jgi:hypothetical protein
LDGQNEAIKLHDPAAMAAVRRIDGNVPYLVAAGLPHRRAPRQRRTHQFQNRTPPNCRLVFGVIRV